MGQVLQHAPKRASLVSATRCFLVQERAPFTTHLGKRSRKKEEKLGLSRGSTKPKDRNL